MQRSDQLSVEETVEYYRADVEALEAFIPWLTAQRGSGAATAYSGDGLEKNSMTFPVYDGTLLSFVNVARQSSLISRNYVYVYSRNKLRTAEDEKRFIRNATIREMGDLWGILSRYILKGMTKATMWSEGVRNGTFLELLLKMKEILDFWDKQGKEHE